MIWNDTPQLIAMTMTYDDHDDAYNALLSFGPSHPEWSRSTP